MPAATIKSSEKKTIHGTRGMTPKEKRNNFLLCLLSILVAIIFLFPLYWLISMSFKTDAESFGKIVTYFPHNFTVQPWVTNFSDPDFLSSLKNSFVIALLSMVLSMGFGVCSAYGMGRYDVPGHKGFLLTFLVTQMLPASLMLTPMYLIFSKMHLLNTYFGPALAISSGSIPFIVVTLRPYFKGIPTALDDAARIDGCNVIQSFLLIMLPVIKTGIITVLVISFLNGWNDLAYSMTFNVQPDMRPLTANIYKFQNKYGTKWNCIMAYGTILVLPVITIFIFLQKYIVGGLTAGSVKE
ncbi:MAG: carbohydrate ABC transporter permease [Lachnospiraceae bacterium]|nr:carbohydrate ABC transporter permease [Lachnospiraceae bacterium]